MNRPLDESWENEPTVSGVTNNTSSRLVLIALAREARSNRKRLTNLESTVGQMQHRLKTAGTFLATVTALAAAAGQHLPALIQALVAWLGR